MKYIIFSALLLTLPLRADDSIPLGQSDYRQLRTELAYYMEKSLCSGRNIAEPLGLYLAGRKLGKDKAKEQIALYSKGLKLLQSKEYPLLKQMTWPALPKEVTLERLEHFKVPEEFWIGFPENKGIKFQVVTFTVDKLKQYAVLAYPEKKGEYPLIVNCHGAAYGVPVYTLPWIAQLAAEGYVVISPSFRGEDLFLGAISDVKNYRSEGAIQNLAGEDTDVLATAYGALKLPMVKGESFAITGHSFGAGAGLLAAARSPDVACVVSYNAWMTNPFEFYWQRLLFEFHPENNRAYLWGSWEEFLNQDTEKQLKGLMRRSAVHHADQIKAPMLMFLAQHDANAYHQSHKMLAGILSSHRRNFQLKVFRNAGHNFLLDYKEPAKEAYKMQRAFLKKHFPPAGEAEAEK